MKVIYENEYNNDMGVLINLDTANKISGALNVSLDNLITNRNNLLDKNTKYFIRCEKGFHAKKAVSILEYIGYDVTFLKNK